MKVIKKINKDRSSNRETIHEYFVNGVIIAECRSYRDYVKRRPTDRIRTKMATIRYLSWNQAELSEVLGQKVTTGTGSRYHESPDFINGRWYDNIAAKDIERLVFGE